VVNRQARRESGREADWMPPFAEPCTHPARAAQARFPIDARAACKAGPLLPLADCRRAAMQLHQTGHSTSVRHFRRVEVWRSGPSVEVPAGA